MHSGKKLIEMGYEPAKWFGEAIRIGVSKNFSEEEMREYIANIPKPVYVEPRDNPLPFYMNLDKGEEGYENENFKAVQKTMAELTKVPTIVNAAVMPDACPTGGIGQIPVGGVAVAKNAIHPSMHSADICCSVYCSNFGNTNPKDLMDAAFSITHFGGGGREEYSVLPVELMERIKGNQFLNSPKSIYLAKSNLGTQGDGNHFLFVGNSKNTGQTMMVTHHGSRGFGAFLYKQGAALAEKYRKKLSPKTDKKNGWIPYGTEEGKAYWEALQIVREWTKLNHSTIHNAVQEKLGTENVSSFWNEHNFVFKDGDLFFHAKGATPLLDKFVPDSTNGLRLIPLNMAQPILIVKGNETENNLGFAPHGAGRNISRSEHIRNKSGKTNEEVFNEEVGRFDIRFFSGKIDISELPSAYKNADEVRRQIEKYKLGKVVDKILPYGSIMAGHQEKPWTKKRKNGKS